MGECITGSVVVGHPNGIHLRPAVLLAEAVGSFTSRVRIRHRECLVDGENALEIMALGAVTGARLFLEVFGPDAGETLDALAGIILDGGR
jgi:phosphotransferase system HPr (HPr) family protein